MPIFFISHFLVKAGHVSAFRAMWADVVGALEASKPATAAQVAYLSEDGSRVSIVHAFPDAAALAAHFEGSGDRSRAAYEHIVPAGWEVYGGAPAAAIAGLRAEATAAGVTLTVMPEALGGFERMGGR